MCLIISTVLLSEVNVINLKYEHILLNKEFQNIVLINEESCNPPPSIYKKENNGCAVFKDAYTDRYKQKITQKI